MLSFKKSKTKKKNKNKKEFSRHYKCQKIIKIQNKTIVILILMSNKGNFKINLAKISTIPRNQKLKISNNMNNK